MAELTAHRLHGHLFISSINKIYIWRERAREKVEQRNKNTYRCWKLNNQRTVYWLRTSTHKSHNESEKKRNTKKTTSAIHFSLALDLFFFHSYVWSFFSGSHFFSFNIDFENEHKKKSYTKKNGINKRHGFFSLLLTETAIHSAFNIELTFDIRTQWRWFWMCVFLCVGSLFWCLDIQLP